ncbi:MAG: tyrosine-type recombinase/integrase [Pseudomonadota bacterium]
MASIERRTRKSVSGKTSKSYRVRFRDHCGALRERNFQLKSEANAFVESLSRMRDEEHPDYAGMTTFGAIADKFLDACEKGRDGRLPVTLSTLRGHRTMLRRHIHPFIGTKKLRNITPSTVNSLVEHLVAACPSRVSAAKNLTLAKAVFAYAHRHGYIDKNPAKGTTITIDLRERRSGKLKCFEEHEATAMLQAADRLESHSNDKVAKAWRRYRVMTHILFHTGIRVSELLGLSKSSFDFAANTVEVSERVDAWRNIDPPKSAHGCRIIPVHEDVMTLARNYLLQHPHELAFANTKGEPLSPRNLRRDMWDRLLREAGVRTLGFHAARHYFASALIKSGANLLEIKTLMGHHKAEFTHDKYGHWIDDQGIRSAEIASFVSRQLRTNTTPNDIQKPKR